MPKNTKIRGVTSPPRCMSRRVDLRRNTTRGEFVLQVAAMMAAPVALASVAPPKVLIVVAHPDDEYAFAATVYRITTELNGQVDQLVLTNGEGGFRYSRLAETYYGLPLTREEVGRSRLPEIRKNETLRAGRILGIRRHWFLDQKDARFTLDGNEAFSGIWNIKAIRAKIADLCARERYDFILGLLPTAETHGHHQAATLLALQAVSTLPAVSRPVVLGSEPSGETLPPTFNGRADLPSIKVAETRVHRISRLDRFGPGESLNYNIVVNWVIAEHKSQGLFQTESGKHSHENFWVFDTETPYAIAKADALFEQVANRRIRQ